MTKVFNRDVVINGQLRQNVGTVVAVAGAATLNKSTGKVITAALTTAQDAIYTLTLTSDKITADSLIFVTVADGTNTQGTPMVGQVNPGAGSAAIEVINKHATSEALNGTLEISYFIVNPAETV